MTLQSYYIFFHYANILVTFFQINSKKVHFPTFRTILGHKIGVFDQRKNKKIKNKGAVKCPLRTKINPKILKCSIFANRTS